MRVCNTITDAIGETPLVRINRLNDGQAEVFAKVEYFNPGSSAKDRVAAKMIEDAEASGALKPGATIIEPTSGNTGVGLALVCAVKGYKLILTLPDTMSVERRKLAAAYGAKIVLTPGSEGMIGAIRRAEELRDATPGAWIPSQFDNASNPASHYATTGPEIWRDLDGEIDVYVATVGTGGTLCGTAKFLKEKNPKTYVVAVEPSESPVLSGGKPGAHKIQGIGGGFIPKNYDASLVDEILTVESDDAGETARNAATREGLLIGISSGAALNAALRLSRRQEFAGKKIVVLLPDCGERYLSTWLFENEN